VASGPAPFVDVWLNKLAVVTTIAGSNAAFLDGTGTGAKFYYPNGVGALPNGNIIVADTYNSRIRIITPAGVVTTLAGSVNGFADGTGTGANFAYPYAVDVLPNGNIIVADTENDRIRLVTYPGGVVTTIAGSSRGFADGTGAAANFNQIYGIAALPNGNIVVADLSNSRVRLITMPGGVVTTLAGQTTAGSTDGTGAAAQFSGLRELAVLLDGNIVVADSDNNRIRLITMPGGVVTTLAGQSTAGYTDATGTNAQFSGPWGIAVLPNGNIVVGDSGNSRIRLITYPGGVVTTLAGGTAGNVDGTGTGAGMQNVRGVAVLPNGSIAVAGGDHPRIRLITPT
jgi:glucose/arabinose dehydrogenase